MTSQPIALWVAPVANLAGVARHILDVARVGLPGWRLVVTAPEGPLLHRLREIGTPVVPLPVDGVPVHESVRALRRTIRTLAPAVVHSHLAKADFLVAVASAGLPVTVISTEHHIPEDQVGFHGSRLKATTRQWAHHARLRRFDAAIAVSESTKRDMLRYWHPSTPIAVILNGIDQPQHRPDHGVGLRILSLTRLSPEKNLETTLRVFERVHAAHPQARLTLAGEGPERDRLATLAASLGVSDVVDFPGFVDAPAAMADHQVLLQPSMADNCSYTLLDAVADGMGVVASDIGGNPEILPARCVAPLDDIADLAEAVVAQGMRPDQRPTLPSTVPTVAEMTERITDVYARAGATHASATYTAPTSELTPQLSVVIAYYKDPADLCAQLECLAAQHEPPRFEVIVSDNEGSVELGNLVADFRSRLDARIVLSSDAPGQCHARNLGVRAARGDVIAICDQDDLVSPTWTAALTAAVRDEDVLATGPLRLDRINPDYAWRTYLGRDDQATIEPPVLQEPFTFLDYQPFVVGCNLAIRRTTYDRLGGMNETIRGGSEDVDFSWRAIESGVAIRVVPEALVDYRLRTGTGEIFRQRRGYVRSQLKVWAISKDQGRPVRGMSARWVLTETAKLPRRWAAVRTADHTEQYRFAARAGAVVGNLQGQFSERVVKR